MKTVLLAGLHLAIEIGSELRKACGAQCLFMVGCALGFAALAWVGTR